MDSPTSSVFEFGGFRLDRRRRLLSDPTGQPVRISAKAFDTLVYLVEHPGVVVDRAALLQAVWPKSIVEENNLSQAVAALRRVLGPGFIVTVERQGYQLVADVRVVPDNGADAPSRIAAGGAFEPSTSTGRDVAEPAGEVARESVGGTADRSYAGLLGRRRTRVAAGAVLAIVAAVVLLGVYRRDRAQQDVAADTPAAALSASSTGTASSTPPKVVVLPCDNLSPDPGDAYLAASLHIEILNRLANLSGLLVAARTSVMQYSAARPPISQIAREFNAAAVMECSVRRAGDSILVTAQLVDPKTDAPLWSKSYPGDVSDLDELFGMQVGIAEGIASSLGAELLPAEQVRLEQRPTRSPEAYALYLRALEVVGTGVTAADYLRRAIEADPEFAWAYVRKADYQTLDAGFLPTLTGPLPPFDLNRYIEGARTDANRALAIDPQLGFAHAVLARASELEGNASAAQHSYRRALELAPNDAEILRRYAEFHIVAGRTAEGLELIQRAARVDPNNRDLGVLLVFTGDTGTALEILRHAAEAAPTDPWARLLLGYLEIGRGDITAARDLLRLAEQLLPPQPRGLLTQIPFYLVYGYGRAGLTEEAKRVLERYGAETPPQFVPRIARVYSYLGVGDLERAREWAAKVADSGLPAFAGWERAFMLNLLDDPVLEQPEFLELRRRLGYRE